MTDQWLIPFQGRLNSGAQQCNLLFQSDKIFIMDNHRLALWAWMQKFDRNVKYNLFHIDAHYDCDPDIKEIPTNLAQMTLQEYMGHPGEKPHSVLFRWDNYLPVFLNHYRDNLHINYCATHQMGLKGKFDHEFMPWDLLKYLENRFFDHQHWIVNLDLDYFFGREFKETPLFHPEYIRKIFKCFKTAYDDGLIDVLTVALSPECCGGWGQAESVLALFLEEFHLEVLL